VTAQQEHGLAHVLNRLSRDLAGQPEGSVLEALRADPELVDWGWTDARLTIWAHQIAASGQATTAPPRGIAD
jgi:hypothetical protein